MHNRKTDNDRQIIYKQHTAGEIIHDKNYKTLIQTVNENLSKLNDWLTVNKLSLNLNKTCNSVYSGDKINDFKITLNGVEIKRVKSYMGTQTTTIRGVSFF